MTSSSRLHRTLRRLAVAVLVLVVGYVGLCLFTYNSAAYRQAYSFIATNPKVAQELGNPVQVRLGFPAHAFIQYGATPAARFHLLADGSKAKGVVDITLREYTDQWQVANADLTLSSGQRIELK
jgi:hypothetical protein